MLNSVRFGPTLRPKLEPVANARVRERGSTMTAHPKSREFEKPLTEQKQKTFNLALQGGGSHGAFTWGVLDRLLEEDKLILDGITAASAGSINAVVLTHGLSSEDARGQNKRCHSFGDGCRP
jgi:predicted acylesterase/phospholipase RssA